jgi:hypothetical protein
VSIRVAEPLGTHPGLVEALLDRISGSGGPPRRG